MNNKMKKFFPALCIGLLCIATLNACSSNKQADASNTKDTAEPTIADTLSPSETKIINDEKPTKTTDTAPDTVLDNNYESSDAFPEFTGTTVGEFTTQDINGETYTQDIFKDYDLTLINVFATWCTPCVEELPDLDKLKAVMQDQGVNVIGVLLDVLNTEGEMEPNGVERAQLLAERTGITFPLIVPDPTYMNGRLIGIEAVPETFFVDKNGNIVGETYSGSNSLEDWIKIVEKELENLKENQ